MGYLIALIVAIWASACTWVLVAESRYNDYFNTWTAKCNDAGGVTSRTRMGFWSDRYECFIDGKKVTLPGYEGQ